MKFLEVKNSISCHGITYTEETREWFLGGGANSPTMVWKRLASRRFNNHPDCELKPIPVIELQNDTGEGSCFKVQNRIENEPFLDYFSLILNRFVSARLKRLLELNQVEAYFTEASLTLQGVKFPEPYYLMNPRDMLPVFDQDISVFTWAYDIVGEPYIGDVDQFCLKAERIPAQQKMFYIHMHNAPLMLCEDVVEQINAAGMTGMRFTPLNEMKRHI